jgi:hypothetical protein
MLSVSINEAAGISFLLGAPVRGAPLVLAGAFQACGRLLKHLTVVPEPLDKIVRLLTRDAGLFREVPHLVFLSACDTKTVAGIGFRFVIGHIGSPLKSA